MTKKSDAGERMCSAESASDTEKMCNAETTCNTEKICNAEKMRNTEKICNVETTYTPETTCDTEKQRDMAWKLLNRDIVFQDTWVQLEASRCELPDGRIIAPFYIRRDPDFAVVVAVTKDKRLVLVRQYRLGAEKVLLELPAGCIEKGEDPKVAAGRELLEETGYQAGNLQFLLKTAPNASNSTAYAYCYLATDVELVAAQHLDAMEDVAVEYMDLCEARSALRDGVFEQAVHVAALYCALDVLEKQ